MFANLKHKHGPNMLHRLLLKEKLFALKHFLDDLDTF